MDLKSICMVKYGKAYVLAKYHDNAGLATTNIHLYEYTVPHRKSASQYV